MALIVDASILYGQADAGEPEHPAIVALLLDERESLITSELAVAEADYLILARLGIDAELAFLQDLAEGTFGVECLTRAELGSARKLAERYRDLQLGLADCSLAVLAQRYNTLRIATLNQRHFRAIEALQGGPFTLLPADR